MREQILRWLCVFIFSWLHRTGADGICSVPDSPARAHIYSCAICYQLKLAESRLHHLRDRNISESCFGHSSPSTLLLREFLDNYSTRLYRKLVAIFTFCWEKSISTSGWPNERVPVISIYFQFITQRRSASLFFTAVVVDGLFIFVLWECCRLLRSSAEKRQIYDPTDWEESWEVAVDSTFRAKKSGGPSSLATRSPGVDELDIPLRFSTLLLHFLLACLLSTRFDRFIISPKSINWPVSPPLYYLAKRPWKEIARRASSTTRGEIITIPHAFHTLGSRPSQELVPIRGRNLAWLDSKVERTDREKERGEKREKTSVQLELMRDIVSQPFLFSLLLLSISSRTDIFSLPGLIKPLY